MCTEIYLSTHTGTTHSFRKVKWTNRKVQDATGASSREADSSSLSYVHDETTSRLRRSKLMSKCIFVIYFCLTLMFELTLESKSVTVAKQEVSSVSVLR